MTDNPGCWENERTQLRTEITEPGSSGDLGVHQTKLVGFVPAGRIVAHYDYRSTFLQHLMIFHLQTGIPPPNRHDWEKLFFGGEYKPTDRSFNFGLFRLQQQAETGEPVLLTREEAKLREDFIVRK